MTYCSPTNSKTYWDIIDTNWDNISHILNIYLPTFRSFWIDKTPLSKNLGEYIVELKETRNSRIVRAFSAAYWNIPEENEEKLVGLDVLRGLVWDENYLHEEKE